MPESQEPGIYQRRPVTSGSQPPSLGLSFLLCDMGTGAPALTLFAGLGLP